MCRPEHNPKLTPLALSSSFKSTPILSLELNKQAKLTGREPQRPTCLQSPGAGLTSCPDTQWLLHEKSPSPGGHLGPQSNVPRLGDFSELDGMCPSPPSASLPTSQPSRQCEKFRAQMARGEGPTKGTVTVRNETL